MRPDPQEPQTRRRCGETATSPALHHLALRAQSCAEVEAPYAGPIEIKANILEATADGPHHGAGCYAVFFADLDGLKPELAFPPAEAEVRLEHG
jgi:hypothetical protein